MGITYEELTGDFSQSNFANAKCSQEVSRRRFSKPIRLLINHLCNPVWSRFVMASVRAGIEAFPSPEDFLSDSEEWLSVAHKPAAWKSVNPKEEATANQIRFECGTLRQRDVVESEFDTPYEQWVDQALDDMAYEAKGRESRGLPPKEPPQPAATEVASGQNGGGS